MQKNSESITLEAHGPAGFWGRLDGIGVRDFLVILLIVGCSAFVWWASEQRETRWSAAHKATQAMLTEQNVILAKIMQKVDEGTQVNSDKLDEMTYVLTLPQTKREGLNLRMPASLRKKTGERP